MFKVKESPDESLGCTEIPKTGLASRGAMQVHGLDCSKTNAPVVKWTPISFLLAIFGHLDFEIRHMDVVTAFLNGNLDEDVYMEVSEGVSEVDRTYTVCEVIKSLYGLNEAQ